MEFDKTLLPSKSRQGAFDQLQRVNFHAKDAKVVRVWRNGRREGLKHPFRKECRFDSDHPHQYTRICNLCYRARRAPSRSLFGVVLNIFA